MDIVTLDLETYYDKDYSLTKMTTEAYVRDPRFEVIGIGVKVNNHPTDWYSGSNPAAFLRSLDYSKCAILAHNTTFDGAILSWHFGIKPKLWLDTLSMARPLHNVKVGGSLKALAEHYGIGVKGDEVIHAIGKRRADFTPAELARYGAYCCNDVDLAYALFKRMARGFPVSELLLIDLIIRMYTEPRLRIDRDLLVQHLEAVRLRKANLVDAMGLNCTEDEAKQTLMSNPKFAEYLQSLGVEPPTKVSARTGKTAWAFSKTDLAFTKLLEHENEHVANAVAARLGVKSTLDETRTEAMIGIAQRGALPIMLRYYGAHTGRLSGADGVNLQNLPRGSALRRSLMAPEGHKIITSDLAQIECVSGDTLVLTEHRGYVKIVDILKTDRLWDGQEWVDHDGVVFKGFRKVISYAGITGTPDHVVYTSEGRGIHLADAAASKAALAVGERGGKPVRFVGNTRAPKLQGARNRSDRQRRPLRAGEHSLSDEGAERAEPQLQSSGAVQRGIYECQQVSQTCAAELPPGDSAFMVEEREDSTGDYIAVYDIVNAGPRHRFTANGVIISNCRMLAYMSGQDDLVEAFRDKRDVYSEFASDIYGRKITKADTVQRFVGKTCVLGLGYGLGAAKFKRALEIGQGGIKVIVDEDEATRIVRLYRDKNFKIAQLWRACDNALADMVNGGSGPLARVAEYTPEGLVLPNGLLVKYAALQRQPDGYAYIADARSYRHFVAGANDKVEWTKLYGAKTVENLTQALARVAITDQMLAISKRYKVVLQVHDEIVCVVPDDEVDEAREFIESVMSTPPTWAPKLPIACEVGVGDNYGETKA
jgi:DNA polymerase I-like protein with 3'-5' exonuclease and polymerase domains